MVQCLTTVMKKEKTERRAIAALTHKTGSRRDQLSSLRYKKEKHCSGIQSSPFKMQLDGMISLMQVGLDFHNTREVLTGRESVTRTGLMLATLFGVKTAYHFMTFDRVRLVIAGS